MIDFTDLNATAPEDARRVLTAIIQGEFDRRITRAGAGLRWLRERNFISARPGWDRRPVLLSGPGRALAQFWGIADA